MQIFKSWKFCKIARRIFFLGTQNFDQLFSNKKFPKGYARQVAFESAYHNTNLEKEIMNLPTCGCKEEFE